MNEVSFDCITLFYFENDLFMQIDQTLDYRLVNEGVMICLLLDVNQNEQYITIRYSDSCT